MVSLICYAPKRFNASSVTVIDRANAIIAEYAAQGFTLTLRQLYYQFVSRDMLANKQSEYHRLGGIINDARLAGLIDWEAIKALEIVISAKRGSNHALQWIRMAWRFTR